MSGGPAPEISQDVLFGIAQLALEQVEGVRATTPPVRVGEILTGRRAKGIRIERDGDTVTVDLRVAVPYGVRIPAAASRAQQAVREAISSMTGLVVGAVVVTVEAIDLPEGLSRG